MNSCVCCALVNTAGHGGTVTGVVKRVNTNAGPCAILTTPATSNIHEYSHLCWAKSCVCVWVCVCASVCVCACAFASRCLASPRCATWLSGFLNDRPSSPKVKYSPSESAKHFAHVSHVISTRAGSRDELVCVLCLVNTAAHGGTVAVMEA